MAVLHCRTCGREVSAADLQAGRAVVRGRLVFCAACIAGKPATAGAGAEGGNGAALASGSPAAYEVIEEVEIITGPVEEAAPVSSGRPPLPSQGGGTAQPVILPPTAGADDGVSDGFLAPPSEPEERLVAGRKVYFQSNTRLKKIAPAAEGQAQPPAMAETAAVPVEEAARKESRGGGGTGKKKSRRLTRGGAKKSGSSVRGGVASRSSRRSGTGSRRGISQRGSAANRPGVTGRGSRVGRGVEPKKGGLPPWAWIGIGALALALIGGVFLIGGGGKSGGGRGRRGGRGDFSIPSGRSGSYYRGRALEFESKGEIKAAIKCWGMASDAYAAAGKEHAARNCNIRLMNLDKGARLQDL